MLKTEDIRQIIINKYNNNDFRIIGNNVQESKTIEIQNAHFIVDKPYIIRKPDYDYYYKEKEWYDRQSLNVNDIPGGAPKMWLKCADKYGNINSNYGWCIYSEENGQQFKKCAERLLEDPHTREAIMIYNRPSMQYEYNKGGMHDFMCCQNMQYFINDYDEYTNVIDCIVNFRSNDAVFGFNNDALWCHDVLVNLVKELNDKYYKKYGKWLAEGTIYWNAGSLHVYEKHFKYLKNG